MNIREQKNEIIAIVIILIIILLGIFFLFFWNTNSDLNLIKNKNITNFEECVAAGYPVAESYPRQCFVPGDKNFVEDIKQSLDEDRDKHGCSVSAGYVWCEKKNKCLREWEESCSDSVGEKCFRENCHGLNVKCGPNPPDICTEIYELGDNCLQYASCGIVNGKCQLIENNQFVACKSCVEACILKHKNNSLELFACESKCGGEKKLDDYSL